MDKNLEYIFEACHIYIYKTTASSWRNLREIGMSKQSDQTSLLQLDRVSCDFSGTHESLLFKHIFFFILSLHPNI